MESLDLKEFVWQSKNNGEKFIIMAITDYKTDDIVVYREVKDRSRICVLSIDDFVQRFQATYDLNS